MHIYRYSNVNRPVAEASAITRTHMQTTECTSIWNAATPRFMAFLCNKFGFCQPVFTVAALLDSTTTTKAKYEFRFVGRHCFSNVHILNLFISAFADMAHQLFCILSRLFTIQANLINRLGFYCQSKMIIFIAFVCNIACAFGNFIARHRFLSFFIARSHEFNRIFGSDLHLRRFCETKNSSCRKMWTNFWWIKIRGKFIEWWIWG